MLKNTIINRLATVKVAKALGSLNKQVVFVGGAMVSLYIDDQAAEDIRPTKDIDLTFQITTATKLEEIRQQLNERGFKEAATEKVSCRFTYEDLLVDVMSTQEVGWAPANRWFDVGFKKAIFFDLEDVQIQLLPLPYFLATKMDAFFDRGLKDLYASKDLEDLVYLFNHASDIVDKILGSDKEVKLYLKSCVQKIMDSEPIMAAIPGHLFYENMEERLEGIKQSFKSVLDELQ